MGKRERERRRKSQHSIRIILQSKYLSMSACDLLLDYRYLSLLLIFWNACLQKCIRICIVIQRERERKEREREREKKRKNGREKEVSRFRAKVVWKWGFQKCNFLVELEKYRVLSLAGVYTSGIYRGIYSRNILLIRGYWVLSPSQSIYRGIYPRYFL